MEKTKNQELINKADSYLDSKLNLKHLGGNKKLREFGNKQAIQLTEIYIETYKQALKDNGL